jgi:hypothetical protein
LPRLLGRKRREKSNEGKTKYSFQLPVASFQKRRLVAAVGAVLLKGYLDTALEKY